MLPRLADVMSSVVHLVVTALWVVAYVLVDVVASYASGPVPGSSVTATSGAVPATPSLVRVRAWLAQRLSSPPLTSRSVVA
jgi:hypothetical protein